MLDDILVKAKLSSEKEAALKKDVKERILALKFGMRDLYENRVIKWNAAYEARPAEASRQFPFQNASNLVIPIIPIHTESLLAQLMAAIFKTHPIVLCQMFGKPGIEGDELKEAYESFMQYVCIEPQELDLYRVYGEGLRECIKYGTVTFKSPWEIKLRDMILPGGDGSGSAKDFKSEVMYAGPRPEKLPFTGFYIPTTAKSIEDADFKAHKRTMLKWELEDRKFRGFYEKKAVDEVLKSADRPGGDTAQKAKEESLGAHSDLSYGKPSQEWDIWECYYQWRYEGSALESASASYAPRMIITYHPKTDQILRVYWDNFKPEWFVGARMAGRDDMYHGYGFAETLWYFQEGASQTYNGYRDNQTVSNTRVWRVSPDSKLHQGYRIYPSAMLPAEKDEIEAMAHGDLGQINIDELRLLLDLAERRSGVSPPQQGFGAGVQTGKRGIYSAMGTLAVLQEGNSRKDLNVSDMRDAHTRLMRLITQQYGTIGFPGADGKHDDSTKFNDKRLELFAGQAGKIREAITKIISGKISLPCYSSTASVNKEVEKQNDLMLSMVMARHYQMVSQLLSQIVQMQSAPQVKQYFIEVIMSSNLLMRKILRNFGHEEVDRLVPDPFKNQGAPNGGQPESALVSPGSALPSANANPQLDEGRGAQQIQ